MDDYNFQLSERAKIDLDDIAILPGRKILIKGNHDYWWSSVSKVRSILPPSIKVIQNDSIQESAYTFCGTRGWINPGMKDFTQQDAKVYNREVQRLKLSLDSAQLSLMSEEAEKDDITLIVLLHYPPFDEKGQPTEIVNTLTQCKPAHVVYGHLHGEGSRIAFEGEYEGTKYHLVSCDYLNFQLKQIV
jgi:predicted phosphohydrolase